MYVDVPTSNWVDLVSGTTVILSDNCAALSCSCGPPKHLTFDWLVQISRVEPFQQAILIYIRSNFVLIIGDVLKFFV